MDITIDDVLAILDEHYNNVKALDALNQELFQLSGRVKERPLLWWTPQVIKSDGSLPEGGSKGKDLFRLPKGHP